MSEPKDVRLEDLIKRFRSPMAIGVALLLVVSGGLLVYAVSGAGRRTSAGTASSGDLSVPTSTDPRLPRKLDGVLVEPGKENFAPWAVMVENHPDARPLSGLSKASVVIEAPTEGGIPRFLALFDPATEIEEVGPVRSARPYFVEWARAWNASYFHVGGSPEALNLISSLSRFVDVNEFAYGNFFWRDRRRSAPHNTYTNDDLMREIVERKEATSSTMPTTWHFRDAATTTERGDTTTINVTYGGSFNVTWKYDAEKGTYRRWQAGREQSDRDGSPVETENIVVIKTDATVLDSVGRLRLRTVGSGDAVAYRDGNRYVLRWRRAAGEPIRFESDGGSEYVFSRGRTWIEVTTDDRVFAGI